MSELYKIVEEGFYEQPWVRDISLDCCTFCEKADTVIFFYYQTEEEAYDALSKCYKRHILTSAAVVYNRAYFAYRLAVICKPSDDIFNLKPLGDRSGLEPILI